MHKAKMTNIIFGIFVILNLPTLFVGARIELIK